MLRSKCFGPALEAVWRADGNGDYAVKEVAPRGAFQVDGDAAEAVQRVQGELHGGNALPGGADFWRQNAGRARAELPGVLRLAVGRRGPEDRRNAHGSPAGEG